MTRPLRLGTRGSALALAQSRLVADQLGAATGREAELVPISTQGDRSAQAVAAFGGTGVFVSALRDRLLAGDIDLAVHSLKDLPTAAEPGLVLAAVPAREDPRDVLISRDGRPLESLSDGATIGTGAPRRMAQLRLLARSHGQALQVVPVRGNVDTRIRKVRDGEYDAVVVARAGLARLGRLDEVAETFALHDLMPAPGQGALAVECRADDDPTRSLLAPLDDPVSRASVAAERGLLATLEAGCTAPVGAYTEIAEGDGGPVLILHAVVAALDGADHRRLTATGSASAAEQLGAALADRLLAAGAAGLIGVHVP